MVDLALWPQDEQVWREALWRRWHLNSTLMGRMWAGMEASGGKSDESVVGAISPKALDAW